MGSLGLHALVVGGLALGAWVLWFVPARREPPVIDFVAQTAPPPATSPAEVEMVEVLPPDESEVELNEAELEPRTELYPVGESPLEMWPVSTDWLNRAGAYGDAQPVRPVFEPVERPAAPQPDTPEVPIAPSDSQPSTDGPGGEEPQTVRTHPQTVPATCPQPVYPPLAMRRGMEGVVVLMVEVDAQGKVVRMRVHESSGHGLLDRAAQNAVAEWRFEPATEDGRPVPGATRVPIRFSMN